MKKGFAPNCVMLMSVPSARSTPGRARISSTRAASMMLKLMSEESAWATVMSLPPLFMMPENDAPIPSATAPSMRMVAMPMLMPSKVSRVRVLWRQRFLRMSAENVMTSHLPAYERPKSSTLARSAPPEGETRALFVVRRRLLNDLQSLT